MSGKQENVPEGWREVRLGEIIVSLDGGTSVNAEDEAADEDGPGILKLSCLNNGNFLPSENKRISQLEAGRLKLTARNKSILISRANTYDLVGMTGYVKKDYPNRYLPDFNLADFA